MMELGFVAGVHEKMMIVTSYAKHFQYECTKITTRPTWADT